MLHELGAANGMVLQYVEPGSPAAKAGIQPGDVVTTVNGKPVKSGSDLVDPITQTAVGNKVHLVYMRSGVQHETDVTVEDRARLFPDRVATYEEDDQHRHAPPQSCLPILGFGSKISARMARGVRIFRTITAPWLPRWIRPPLQRTLASCVEI